MSTPDKLMMEIRQMLQNGQYNDAAAACKEALGEAPDNPDLRMLMGLCDEAAGRPESARAWMDKALEKNPAHPAAAYHLGRLLLAAGEDEKAGKVLKDCVARDPNHAAARTLLARVEQRAGRLDEAIDALRTALRADEEYAPAHAGLAALLLRRGDIEDAHKHASHAIRLRPSDAFSQVTMAQVFQAQGHLDFAEQCLRNALERQPEHPQLRAALDQLLRVRHGGDEEASTPEALMARMREHYRRGQLRPAAELALALQHRWPGAAPERLELAEVLMDAGYFDASKDLIDQTDPDLPRHPLTQARLVAMRGQTEEAIEQLGALFSSAQAGLRHDARRLAADLHLRGGRMAPALAVLQPLLEEPDLAPATTRMIAQLEHARGETATARRLLETLAERDQLNDAERAVTHNLLGRVLDESGAWEAAGRHLVRGEWREPFMVAELDQVSPPELRKAWFEVQSWEHGDQPVDDGRRAPLFVAGWPGSGREALLPAVAGAGRFGILPPEDLARRRELLGLPARPDQLLGIGDSDLRRVRKRYLQGAPETEHGPLETGLPETTALPAIARYFPDARLVWLQAHEPALRLHWRLAGCREIERMVAAWQAEQALFARLRQWLPIRVIELDSAQLIDDPNAAGRVLAEQLGIDEAQSLGTVLARSLQQAGYRYANHWKNYQDIL
ncbi:MAG: tetratricopeptide repeat protein [Wenzhouxiangella sp.]|nr:MAG: tetratricopeptide repeat protein [Wenzhouxiangella sp.]